MAISRARKEELVALYSEMLSKSDGFVVVHTTGLTVQQIDGIRKTIREAQGHYVRTKNTLLRIALQQNGWIVPEELLNGPVSVAFGQGNFPSIAKAILTHFKDPVFTDKASVMGGLMTGTNILNAAQVEVVSNLPSLEEMRSQLAGLIVQPAVGLVSLLNSATGQIVNVLQALVDEKGEKTDGEAA